MPGPEEVFIQVTSGCVCCGAVTYCCEVVLRIPTQAEAACFPAEKPHALCSVSWGGCHGGLWKALNMGTEPLQKAASRSHPAPRLPHHLASSQGSSTRECTNPSERHAGTLSPLPTPAHISVCSPSRLAHSQGPCCLLGPEAWGSG